MKKTLIILSIAILFAYQAGAQQINSMYWIPDLPLTNQMNPAFMTPCKFYMEIPVFGNINLNANTNAFSMKDIYTENSNGEVVLDIDGLYNDELKDVNYLSFDTRINIIAMGLTIDKILYTLQISDVFVGRVGFRKGMFTLPIEGNTPFVNDEIEMGPRFQVDYYREYAFGMAMEPIKDWRFGARAKFLTGIMHARSTKSDLGFYTGTTAAGTVNENAIRANYEIEMLNPFTSFYYDQDSMEVSNEEREFSASSILGFSNPGFALDLGAHHLYDKNWSFAASVLDLGFISAGDDAQVIRANGSAAWTGMDIPSTLENNGIGDQLAGEIDSVMENLNASVTDESYVYWLDPKIYLAAKYQYDDLYHFGVVSRSEIFMGRLISSLTFTGIYRPTDWFNTLLSYSIMNNSFTNLGFGFKIGPFYATTDNIIGLIWSGYMANKIGPLMDGEAGTVWTSSTQVANFRFGFYIPIGCEPSPEKGKFY